MVKKAETSNLAREAEMIAIWTHHLSIGNRAIDSAHEHIFSIINRVSDLIGAQDGDALTETLDLLEDSLCAYFEVEEKIAQAVKVDFTEHNLVHQHLLSGLQYMRNVLAEKSGKWPDGEVEAFIPWAKRFIQHIKVEGEALKFVLNTHYYDFKPE